MTIYARFMVNPKTVRVSIRHYPKRPWMWLARVATRDGEMLTEGTGEEAETAVFDALARADEMGMPGIDLGMQWSYEHPWRRKP